MPVGTAGSPVGAPLGRNGRGRGRSRPVVAAALLLVALAGGAALRARSLPVVSVGGLDLTGLDRADAVNAVAAAATRGPTALSLRADERPPVDLPTAALGVKVDVPASVARARQAGRQGLLGRLVGRGGPVDPVLELDEEALARTVSLARAGLDAPASDGGLVVSGVGTTATPPAPGRSVSAEDVRAAVLSSFATLPPASSVQVRSTAVPAHVTVGTVEAVATKARAFLGEQVELRAGDRSVTVPGTDLGPALTVSSDGDEPGHGLRLGLDPVRASAPVDRAAAALGRAAVPPSFAAPAPAPALTTQGDATWRPRPATVTDVGVGTPGESVSAADVLAALARSLQTGDPPGLVPVAPVPVPTAPTRPDSLIGTFTTKFVCCQPRVTNIALIARTVDATVVPPGGEFSLNGLVGRRTREKGYVDAPFILDGELSTDVGGGVSQFATTMYNAAFFAGLPLLQHQAHSFYISRYPAGREATVNYPTIDLRWRNDTAAPVVIRTSVDRTSLTVALYGNNGGRSVSAQTGPRLPTPGAGFRVTVTRRIVAADGTSVQDRATTTYGKAPAGE